MTDTHQSNLVSDKNGNSASISYFGSRKAAKAALASLVDCWNCVNCRDCERCTDCDSCDACRLCTRCVNCTLAVKKSDAVGLRLAAWP